MTTHTERASRTKRLATSVYGGRRGSPILDGPWWLGLLAVLVTTVLTFDSSPWRWLVLPIAGFFFWLPGCVRWGRAVRRSVVAFREGFRS